MTPEQMQKIVDGAPHDATHYSNEDCEIVYYQKTNNVIFWDNEYNMWDDVYFTMPELKSLSSLRTELAKREPMDLRDVDIPHGTIVLGK